MFEFLKNIMNNKKTPLTNKVDSVHRILKTDFKKDLSELTERLGNAQDCL